MDTHKPQSPSTFDLYSEAHSQEAVLSEKVKCQQAVFWDQQLTIAIQHDSYRPATEAIFAKSERLSIFTFQKIKLPALDADDVPHLRLRSHSRRRLYKRPDPFLTLT